MNKSPKIKEILDLIKGKDRFLITSHKDPDGDSIGSQLGLYRALKDYGKEVLIVNQGGMPEKYRFLDPTGIINFDKTPLQFTPDAVFILECPTLERIGFVSELLPKSAIKINIDHHKDNGQYGDINWVDTESCAVGELIYFLIDESELKITAEIAEDLYAAIICDTGNFRFASTTARGMKIAADLVEYGRKSQKNIRKYI